MPNGIKQEASTEQKKLAIIRLLQILEKETDVNHPLKQDEIIKKLKNNYGITVERKSIGRNLQLLQDMFEKDGANKSSTAIVLETGGRKGSFIDKRLFEDSEIRMLIDSVLASKHIPGNYTKDLIEKLCSLSNKYFKSHVKHIYSVDSWDKTDNKALFWNIEVIDEAIEKGKQITFDYNKYGADKKLHKTTSHKESPYQLILHNQKYYLMYGSEKWHNVGFLRLDKISNINISEDKITPLKEQKGYEYGIDYKKFSSSLPYMFGDDLENITFIANSCVVDDIVDYFGSNAKIKEIGNNELEVSVKASPNAMEYWAMQYLKFVEVKTPVSLRERIKENIKNANEKYN